MKRALKITILFVIAIMLSTTFVNAVTSTELADKLYDLTKDYGITAADRVKAERYLAENPVTEEQANKIVAKTEQIVQVAKDEGVTDLSKLPATSKQTVITLAKEAAAEMDLTLVVGQKEVKIYKDSKLIETVKSENGKLAYTGNENNVVLVALSIVTLALAITIVAKRKIANA